MDKLIDRAAARIVDAITEFKPVAVFSLFSGGHDSLCCTYIAMMVPQVRAAVHINTGIGVDETRVFVRETCMARSWPYLEYKALENVKANGLPDPQNYREMVLKHGFPGPHGHQMMYNHLKERQIRRLCRDHKKKRGDRIMLIVGCRSQESQRRMRNTKPIDPQGSTIWVNPIHDFTKTDCGRVITHAGLRRNPVVDLIHKSGECLCGAFAKPGELDELAMWFPAKAAEIRALEREVRAKHGWGWEEGPQHKVRAGQQELFMPLCHNCLIADSI